MSMSAETAKDDNGQPLDFKNGTTAQIAEDALEGLKALIDQYANPDAGLLLQAARRIHLDRLRL